ncbi:MAG: hypothetical protein MJE68_02270, partial [Proteobacteria bacterium]|nr:hypothetical protein [Pseudomonadota bacterium]
NTDTTILESSTLHVTSVFRRSLPFYTICDARGFVHRFEEYLIHYAYKSLMIRCVGLEIGDFVLTTTIIATTT